MSSLLYSENILTGGPSKVDEAFTRLKVASLETTEKNLFTNTVASLATIASPATAPSTTGFTSILPSSKGFVASFTADTTTGSAVLTNLSSTSGLVVGQPIIEPPASGFAYPVYIPLGAEIVSIDSASQITMSKVATGTTTGLTLKTFSEKIEIIGGVASAYAGSFLVSQHSVTRSSRSRGNQSYAFEFMTDAANITTAGVSVMLFNYRNGSTPNSYKVAIDDVYQTATPQAYGGANMGYITIQFATAGIHKVRVEFPDPRTFEYLYVINGARLWKPERANKIRAAFFGDSYFNGQETTNLWVLSNIAFRTASALGWLHDQCAQGGTGYVANGTTNYAWSEVQRQSDVAVRNYDVIVCFGSVNDSGFVGTPSTIQAAALTTWRGIRANAPNAPIFVFGCPTTVGTSSANATIIENALKAAFAEWGDANAYFIPITTDPSGNWIDAANSGVYIGADTTHLTDIGCQYFADKMAQKIRGLLSSRS